MQSDIVMAPDVQTASTSNVEEAATPNAQKASTLNYVQQRSVTPEVELNKSIPLENIVNAPELPQQKSKQTSRKRHSIVITSTPMKDILEKKKKTRKKRST